jgi:hypothetical protein
MDEICIIKFIINPTLNNGYEILHIFQPSKKLIIRFLVKHVDCLLQLVETMKKTISFKGKYKVQFSFSDNKAIKSNQLLLSEIRSLFGDTETLEDMIEKVRSHCKKYGNCPDFTATTDSSIEKIVNYIRSVIGNPHIDKNTALDIAKKL